VEARKKKEDREKRKAEREGEQREYSKHVTYNGSPVGLSNYSKKVKIILIL